MRVFFFFSKTWVREIFKKKKLTIKIKTKDDPDKRRERRKEYFLYLYLERGNNVFHNFIKALPKKKTKRKRDSIKAST